MARSRSGFPRGPSRRRVGWEVGPVTTGVNQTASTSALGTGGTQALLDGLTLVRMRGHCAIYLSVADAALSGFHGALGVCVISENQNTVGVTAVNQPLDDDAWDGWLWHQYFDVRAITATIADGVNASSVVQRFEVDSKAMRKLKDTDVVVLVQQFVEVGTSSVRVEFDSRLLMKLP